MNSLGLYLHLPFCKQRCRYCDFASSVGKEALIPEYRLALIEEFNRAEFLWGESRFDTIFFGGGTPSLWPAKELYPILEAIFRSGRVAENAEISLEANPGTMDPGKLKNLRQMGFNRISLGVQSSEDRLLQIIGRIHTSADVGRTIEWIREAGFDALNLDLIFGLPHQGISDWEKTLGWALNFKPEHLSCYGLQLEEETPLARDVARGRMGLPTDDETADMMEMTMSLLPRAGYEQYEISNYSRPGNECRHNRNYWDRGDYLGLGAGAVSTVGRLRWSNSPSIEDYLNNPADPPREREELTERQMMAETIMLGLRLRCGIHRAAFNERFGVSLTDVLGSSLPVLIDEGWMEEAGDGIRLTKKSVPVSNVIIGRCCGPLLD